MPLGAELRAKRATSQSSILRSGRYPDRIQIRNEDLADLLGSALRPADDTIQNPWVPINEFHHLEERLSSWVWTAEDPEPAWLASAYEESRWATETRWTHNGRGAWVFDDIGVVTAPYTVTMTDRLDGLSSPYHFSSLLKSWIIVHLDQDGEDLARILEEYEIPTSVGMSAALEGRSGWQDVLEEKYEAALAEGIRVPDNFRSGRKLKEHQQSAVAVMAHQRGANLLADQVGLGKGGEFTCGLIALNNFLEEIGEEQSYPAIVSVTKSMKAEIAEEIHRWKHDARIEVISGTKAAPIGEDAQFVILNHDILSKRLPDILDLGPRAFIADEAHVFKNEEAKRSKAAQELADAVRDNTENPYVVLASGTPFLNSPIELWSTLSILGIQDEFASYAKQKLKATKVKVKTTRGWQQREIWPKRAFEMYFCKGRYDRYGNWMNHEASHTQELNKLLLKHGMIRRRKSDVMHPLPPLFENLAMMEMTPEGAADYRRVEDEFREVTIERAREIALEEDVSVEYAIRVALQKLVNGESIMQMTALRQEVAKAKIPATVAWIDAFMDGSLEYEAKPEELAFRGITDGNIVRVGDDPTRRKLIVFAHHRAPRQLLIDHPDLQRYGMVTILPGGEMSDEEIQENKHAFQTDPDVRLMICTMAAREGHTLTAAKDVYIHEVPFVPSWIVQMGGRAWARISEQFEPHEAVVHHGIAPGTIDIPAVRKVSIKKAVFSAIVDAEGQDETIDDLREESVDTFMELLQLGKRDINLAR